MVEKRRLRMPGLARTAAVISLVATGAWVIDLFTRPPCPEGYVRFLDVEVALPPASLFVSGISFWLAFSIMKLGSSAAAKSGLGSPRRSLRFTFLGKTRRPPVTPITP